MRLFNALFLFNTFIRKGFDYYIRQNMYIYYYDDPQISCVPINETKGYFEYPSYASSGEIRSQYTQAQLKPRMPPQLIFSNRAFNRDNRHHEYKYRYEDIVHEEIVRLNKSWTDVLRVVLREERDIV